MLTMLRGMTRVCVFGSANMDLVVYAERAPKLGETVPGARFSTVPGGKGANQAIAAARAGGAVTMVGAVGQDRYGDELLQVLADAGIHVDTVERVDETTGTAHIVVEAGGDNRGDNQIVVVPGANGSIHRPPDTLDDVLARTDTLLLQLELPLDAVRQAARQGRERGVRVVLTPAPAKPLPDELLADVDLLVPNEHEAKLLTGENSIDAAVAGLLERVPEVVVTMGVRGSRWRTRDGDRLDVPAPTVQVRDTTAAGDTFVGTLAVVLGEGRPMPDALGWATAAAALSVQREGASPSMPTREEILRAFTSGRVRRT
jgi:ribokinase